MQYAALTTAFEVLTTLLAAILSIRMASFGMHRRYPFLFVYFATLTVFSLLPLVLNTQGRDYYYSWLVTEPLTWIFQILVVRELCSLVLEHYRGLATLGRWAMYGALVISGAASLVSLLPHVANQVTSRSHLLAYYVAGSRAVNLALGVFLLLMMIVVSRFPIPLSRNVVSNSVVFTVLFFSNSLEALLRAIFDMRIAPQLDMALTASGVVSLLVWLFLLTPSGEQVRGHVTAFRSDREEHVLHHMDELNKLVLNLGRT